MVESKRGDDSRDSVYLNKVVFSLCNFKVKNGKGLSLKMVEREMKLRRKVGKHF